MSKDALYRPDEAPQAQGKTSTYHSQASYNRSDEAEIEMIVRQVREGLEDIMESGHNGKVFVDVRPGTLRVEVTRITLATQRN